MDSSAVRVFLADDHPIFRRGLRGLVDAQPDMQVVGEADDGHAAIAGVIATHPDVAVLDISMPGMNGPQAAEELRRQQPGVKVLALSAHEDRGYVEQMLAVGACGYVVKRAAGDELVRAIRTVAAGHIFVDPVITNPPEPPPIIARTSSSTRSGELSEREAEVLTRIARGHAMKTIASALQVGLRTVETYKARGMEKLNIKTRAELVRYAIERGWLKDAIH
jgi:DNA-binding NarL/FixJ family response regulator